MKRTLLLFAAISLALAIGLALVGDPARWPAPEAHPHQGEGADATTAAAENSKPVHSRAALARLIREPQNTWSNLAFVFAGAWLVSMGASRLARAVGLVLIAVGIGSFFYHASGSDLLRNLDVGAMYWIFLMVAALCLGAVFPGAQPKLEKHVLTLFLVTLALAIAITASRNVVLFGVKPLALRFATALAAATVIGSLALVVRRREVVSDALQMLAIVTLFGLAAACQTFDRPGGKFYRPDAFIQAHAVWHVLAAAAFGWAVKLLDERRA